MADRNETPQTALVNRLMPVPLDGRQALRRGVFDKAGHDKWFDALRCLRQTEMRGSVIPGGRLQHLDRLVYGMP
jgi:hypothetical protein